VLRGLQLRISIGFRKNDGCRGDIVDMSWCRGQVEEGMQRSEVAVWPNSCVSSFLFNCTFEVYILHGISFVLPE